MTLHLYYHSLALSRASGYYADGTAATVVRRAQRPGLRHQCHGPESGRVAESTGKSDAGSGLCRRRGMSPRRVPHRASLRITRPDLPVAAPGSLATAGPDRGLCVAGPPAGSGRLGTLTR